MLIIRKKIMPSKSEDSKSMDVSKPGQSAPDISSRPVIVSHRMVQDPMMKDEEKEVEEKPKIELEQKTEQTRGDRVIQPLSAQTDSEVKDEPEEVAEAEVQTEEQAAPTDDTQAREAAEEAATVDAVAEQADVGNKKKAGVLTPEEKARQESIQKLIEDKKYFVPIGQGQHKRNFRVMVVLLVGVLGGLYWLASSGIIAFPKSEVKIPHASPVPVTKPVVPTYESLIDGFRLQYPESWKVSEDHLTGSPEYIQLEPREAADNKKTIRVQFNRLSPQAGKSTYPGQTLAQVDYFELPESKDQKLYIRQAVYIGHFKQYYVIMHVTGSKGAEKPGDSFEDREVTFLAENGKTKLYLASVSAVAEGGKTGFSTLESARSYIASNKEYAEAKNILMSVKIK